MRITEDEYQAIMAKRNTHSEAKETKSKKQRSRGREKNKTEARFEIEKINPLIYQGRLHHDYGYERIRLTLEDETVEGRRMTYTPDFDCKNNDTGRVTFFEVKGKWKYEDAMVKFKAARKIFGHVFDFECWEYDKGIWRQIWK